MEIEREPYTKMDRRKTLCGEMDRAPVLHTWVNEVPQNRNYLKERDALKKNCAFDPVYNYAAKEFIKKRCLGADCMAWVEDKEVKIGYCQRLNYENKR